MILLYLTLLRASVAVMDVGSTGTRLNVFTSKYSTFRYSTSKYSTSKYSTSSFENSPGLSDLDDKEMEEKLLALVRGVGKDIPIGIYCTAGFRGLSPDIASHKLKVIKDSLRGYNIKEIRILSGEEEGYLAYLALKKYTIDTNNLLLVDMGGKSVQVVYPLGNTLKSISYQLGHTVGISALNRAISLEDVKNLPGDIKFRDIYLSSFFYDVLEKIKVNNVHFNLRELVDIFKRTCRTDSPHCRDFYYVVVFLLGLGIPEDKPLHLLGYVSDGLRFNWTIGKALELINGI